MRLCLSALSLERVVKLKGKLIVQGRQLFLNPADKQSV